MLALGNVDAIHLVEKRENMREKRGRRKERKKEGRKEKHHNSPFFHCRLIRRRSLPAIVLRDVIHASQCQHRVEQAKKLVLLVSPGFLWRPIELVDHLVECGTVDDAEEAGSAF